MRLRSSQGGQHTLGLPEDARLQSVAIDGVPQPIRQEGLHVTLPIKPGTQNVTLSWRQPSGIMTRFHTPAVGLGMTSVNSRIHVTLAENRWVLLTRGPRLGPAVLFWGVLIVIGMLALAFSRVGLTPLNATAWGSWRLISFSSTTASRAVPIEPPTRWSTLSAVVARGTACRPIVA